MSRIGWLADYFSPAFNGGAEISNALFIKEGRRRGHDIVEVNTFDYNMPPDLDYCVASNTGLIEPHKINWLLKQRYIMRLHDIRSMPHYAKLFRFAEAVVFLSPLHELLFKERYRLPQTLQIPNTLENINQYKPLKKKHRAVYVGNLAPHKGFPNIINYAWANPKLPIDCYGKSDATFQNLPSNLHLKGTVPHTKILKILGEAEYFIFLLSEPGTFSLSMLEAYLCGCRFITNEYEGMWTWNMPWTNRSQIKKLLQKAPTVFWEFIEKRIALEQEEIMLIEKCREAATKNEACSAVIPNIQVR